MPLVVQHEIIDIEQEVADERDDVSNSKVMAKVSNSVPNLGTLRAHQNQYMHTIDLYWYSKNL